MWRTDLASFFLCVCFTRHQRLNDGELVASGLPLFGATEVVEDVADLIIEEMLAEHALELAQMCDDMGERLFDEEFQDS